MICPAYRILGARVNLIYTLCALQTEMFPLCLISLWHVLCVAVDIVTRQSYNASPLPAASMYAEAGGCLAHSSSMTRVCHHTQA